VSYTTPVTSGSVTCGVGACTAPTITGTATTSWDFGNVTCTTAGGCKVTLGLRARVAATTTRGTVLTDSVTATYLASQNLPQLTVIEPNLTLGRSASPTTGLSIGQSSTITVTLTNGGAADAAVVGAVVTLATPANTTARNYVAGSCPAATATFGSGSASFTFPDTATTLVVGASCNFTYDLTIATSAPGNSAISVAAGSVTTQSVVGAVPPAKRYTATDSGLSISTAPYANGQPCTIANNCTSNACDTDNLCGLVVSHGPCSGPNVCRSATCSVLGVCGPAGGCLVDGDCSSAQFCNSVTLLCTPKLDNGTAIPSIAGHAPALAGACSQAAGAAVCKSGVCDTDNLCGYADGSGTCSSTPAAVCRSGACSVAGVCGVAGGCLVDGDCTSTEYCNTPTHACVPKLTNGTAIVSVAGHNPAISGTCSSTVASIVCVSSVCDADDKCGYADGDGPCTSSTVAVCRSGLCAKSGVCGACAIDSDCTASQYCDTPTKTCASKLPNGDAIPTIAGHSPAVATICTQSAAAVVCASGACDADNKCGYADGNGTCTSTNAAVCRSTICSASGVCGIANGCLVDGDCASTQYCNTPAKLCAAKAPNGAAVPTVLGHVPVLAGACNDTAGSIGCATGVCDIQDNRCGYADGDGICTAATLALCRSGLCSKAGVCGVLNGCLVDADCTATQYCDTPTRSCTPKLPNGAAVPTVTGHVPQLAGQCSIDSATIACVSVVCDTADNKCGYADGDGTCTQVSSRTVCRSGVCSTAGVCGPVTGCIVDGDCLPAEYCNTPARTCAPKVVNGSVVPSVAGHIPQLSGACTDSAATAACISSRCDTIDDRCGIVNGNGPCTVADGSTACRSAVCDAADSQCGYADGDGPCTNNNASIVCRSGLCSVSGNCVPAGGCLVDADCSAIEFCNTQTRRCSPKLPNGSAIPTFSGHNPLLTGVCSSTVGTVVCVSAVCDVTDNLCGYANGDGPCTATSASTVCRSGQCGGAGTCMPASGCTVDADCSSSQFCNTQSQLCNPKLPNGAAIPAIAGHDPNLNGQCNPAVAALVCTSATCDTSDNKCGLPDDVGPCTVATAATVCRSGACANGTVCGTNSGCQSDADCQQGQTCDAPTNQCVAIPATGCQNTSDCPTNQTCNTSTHHCLTKSAFEGNLLEGGGCNCSVGKSQHSPSRAILLIGIVGAAAIFRRRRRAY